MRVRTEFIRDRLEDSDLKSVWMSILRTHIHFYSTLHEKEDFSDLEEFAEYSLYDEDLFRGLSLTEISMLFEYALSLTDQSSRKKTGSYYTPDDVAEFIAEQAERLDHQESAVWLDPASGVGNLSYFLLLQQEDPEQFLLNNLVLQDINSLALKTAQVIFALHFQDRVDAFYQKIADRFRVRDFLERYSREGDDLFSTFDEIEEGYDYVIVNPPYLSTVKDPSFITGGSRDLYSYFLEKILLTARGFVAVTPQSFLNGEKFRELRTLFMKNIQEVDLYVYDNMPDSLFKGYKYGSQNTNTNNSVRACIIVAQRGGESKYRITPMLRWPSEDRGKALSAAPKMLTSFTPEVEVFPKLSEESKRLYDSIKESEKRLEEILSDYPTPYSLNIPSTPRYYVSATKRELNRSSMQIVHFETEEELNYAYILLNSQYLYWWWRVMDGGLTLSQRTLYSLPLLEFEVNQELVKEIEESEEKNLVVKVNAGKKIENVKHDEKLVKKVTGTVISDEGLLREFFNFSKNNFTEWEEEE